MDWFARIAIFSSSESWSSSLPQSCAPSHHVMLRRKKMPPPTSLLTSGKSRPASLRIKHPSASRTQRAKATSPILALSAETTLSRSSTRAAFLAGHPDGHEQARPPCDRHPRAPGSCFWQCSIPRARRDMWRSQESASLADGTRVARHRDIAGRGRNLSRKTSALLYPCCWSTRDIRLDLGHRILLQAWSPMHRITT